MDNKNKKEFIIKLKLLLNKKLYEDKIITIDVYQKVENLLINNLYDLNKREKVK